VSAGGDGGDEGTGEGLMPSLVLLDELVEDLLLTGPDCGL
jgi:hypothetical protein